MDEYTITFLSDACSDFFRDNTISNFRNYLSTYIDLTDGEWEIALTSVSYTGSHYLNDANDKILGYSEVQPNLDMQIDVVWSENFRKRNLEDFFKGIKYIDIRKNSYGYYQIRRTFGMPYYRFFKRYEYMFGLWETEGSGEKLFDILIETKKQHLFDVQTSDLDKYSGFRKNDIYVYLNLNFGKKLTILAKELTKDADGKILTIGNKINYEDFLKDINLTEEDVDVSFDAPILFETQVGKHLPDPRMGTSLLMIYSDLIPPQYVGGIMAPLLRIIPSRDGRQTSYFTSPIYYKINRDYINDFHIYIKHENGEAPSFTHGTFSGTLSLRKRIKNI